MRKVHISMPLRHDCGDTICLLAAALEYAERRGCVATTTDFEDVVRAYGNPRLEYGEEGELLEIDPLPWHRQKFPGDCWNYLGTYMKAMGLRMSAAPRLRLPEFPDEPRRAVIQPRSSWAENPPPGYVQAVVDEFAGMTGMGVYAVGHPDKTDRTLRNVSYELLEESVPALMRYVRSAAFVLSPRSVVAHVAAGYGRPSFVWMPGDGENWHLDYPGWPAVKVEYERGVGHALGKLRDQVRKMVIV